ncbi:MAG: murein L,D-transpeptidase catalytic domain family protein [Deltaproteobacteria bacterium]|nr:murein L,D-transpeptidase catalytic domain family protein [Deltaproteobacteria bacterium]
MTLRLERHLAPILLTALAALAACDPEAITDTSLVARERPTAVSTSPTEPEPDPEPDPEPEPDPDPDPEPDPDPDPEPEPEPEPEPDPVDPSVHLVTSFPYVHRGDTSTGARALDRYGCAPTTREGGPEVVYRVTLPADGFLAASLDGIASGVDVDVHILGAGPTPDASTCVDRGNWTAGAWLPAGDYWVVADTWVDATGLERAGAYTLTLGLTTADAFVEQGLSEDVLGAGLVAFDNAWAMGDTDRFEYTIIDFSLHSAKVRLWTIDLTDGSLVFAERVTHGEGSQDPSRSGYASTFSDVEGSHQSSLGMMRTALRYDSASNGLSLRLDGLEPGINQRVYERAIVIHSDSYASAAFVAQHGRMGLSWGCQVVDPAMIVEVIDTLEDGALMWSYYPDPAFLASSAYLEGWSAP